MSWVYLSHILCETTPLYSGTGRLKIERTRSINEGDSSNNSELALPAHAGTHVDGPRHFDPTGSTLDAYPADYWQAVRPWLLDVPCRPEDLLELPRMGTALEAVPVECDLLLLRTGAEAWRLSESNVYSKRGPAVAAEVAHWLRRSRRLKFLGIDFISISSFAHRKMGREAHRAFLAPHESGAPPILLVEDMALAKLERAPSHVWVVPLLYSAADGAPVTVLAQL